VAVRPLLVLRWSARDLRRRWLQVAVIALIIAIGTGTYAALAGTATWRRESNDASFAMTSMYDLRVRAAEGAGTGRGEMLAVLSRLPDPSVVEAAEERLVVPTQVDASTVEETILVPGRIVGVDVGDGGPHVNAVHVAEGNGRTLGSRDAGARVGVLERNFADFYGLPPEGELVLAGGTTVDYVGRGMSPEYFFVTTEDGGFFAEANFAVVFLPLDTAQEVTGQPGRVNDLVLRLADGADPGAVAADLADAFEASGTGLGVTVMQREDEDAYRILYDDIEGDQRFWNVLAALILAGATFGAFNLASRMVEAQRREIGVGMALGASPWQIAVRPLLVGVEIAVLGAVLGVIVGIAVVAALRPVYTAVLPLPVWHTALQWRPLVRAAALGFVLPVIATAWPVWRAVRVAPVDAIATTHRSARSGLAPLLRRLRWPVSAFRRMPLGNTLRTPRRTALTALGIGAAIATLVTILGLLDSFLGTMERADRDVLGQHPDRVSVSLDRFVSSSGPELVEIEAAGSVGEVEPVVRVAGTLGSADAEPLDVVIEVLDLDSDVWAPAIERGDPAARDGIVIARKAATDLGVGPGDEVVLRHPAQRDAGFTTVDTPLTVIGIHPAPFRFGVYLDRSQLEVLGVPDVANQLYVLPARGSTPDDVEADLFRLDSVASVQPVAAVNQIIQDSMDEFAAVFRALQGFVLLLALLMAYNATSINADERARERATLFAFGMPARRVIGLEIAEGVLYGVLGTLAGLGIGALIVRWVITSTMATTMPDLGLDVVVSPTTVVTAAVLGIVAVAAAPLLTIRRLVRMDIPGTLRVVE
jgi:putative ABC transport system permease protein